MNDKNSMTPRERVYRAIELMEPDRVPLLASTRFFAVRYLGHTLGDCYKKPDLYVEGQIRMTSDFAVDAVWDLAGMNPIERALGQHFSMPEDDVPFPLEPLLKAPEDFEKLPRKVEIKGKGWTDYLTGITKSLRQRVGEDIPVIANVPSPFRIACMLRGTHNLYMDLYERPDFVKELLEYLIQPTLDYASLQAEVGGDILYTACPVASRTMISRSHFEEFVHPVHIRLFDYWKNKLGRKTLFHVCGDWSDRFDLIVGEGPDIIHVDKIDLAWLKKEFGAKACINGNVGTTTTLMLGSPEDVKKEAIECIKKAGAGGGFMLGADCAVPPDTPIENMKALKEAIMEAGNYPLNMSSWSQF